MALACPSLHSINRHIPPEGGGGPPPINDPGPGDDDALPSEILVRPNRPANLLMYRHVPALVEKEISAPSMDTATWTMDYSEIPLTHYTNPGTVPSVPADQHTNWTKVVAPNGAETTHFYHWDAETYGGEMKRQEVRETPGASSVLQASDYTHTAQSISVGIAEFNSIYPPAKQRYPVFQTMAVTTQNGDSFTSETAYNLDLLSSDYSFGKPIQTKSYSSVSGSTAPRVSDTTYDHNMVKWILGLPTDIVINNRPTATYSYDPLGQKTSETRNGAAYATYNYNADGTIDWAKDALLRKTTALQWKRGTPQEIKRADTNSVFQFVDDNGWLTDMTDANGNQTSYERDDMGRLTKYTPPASWAATDIDYSFGSTDITQTITKAGSQSIITYDNMYRPTLVETIDLSNNSSTFVKSDYDAAGQTTFTSFPSATSAALDGTNFTYDGLGRSKTTAENVTPFAATSTDYYSGHKRRATDAGGFYTDYYSTGYGGPGKGELLKIVQPLGVTTEMIRNIWGEMEQLRQHGNSGGFSADQSRYYYYNAKRQVCRYSEKEGGDTLYAYDLAGYMTSYQKGVGEGSACTAPAGTDKVTLGYDDLGRLETTNFTDTATPDITNTYDNNGNLLTTNRGSGAGAVNWAYTYGNANNLETEILSVDTREYALSYTYNPDGSMASRALPSGIPGVPGRTLILGNDGLGRQTSVTGGGVNYVSGVSYHPSGAIAGMTYGNGQIFSQTLTPRLQPLRLLSQIGTDTPPPAIPPLDMRFEYDPRGKVTAIVKGDIPSDSRTYGYDALGRLTSATGLWGSTGSMTYDALGNVRSKIIGGHILTMFYDDDNRLTNYTHIGNGPDKDLEYDDRGNVKRLGGLFFTYDKSDQPINISGTAAGTYRYDGHKRRVKSIITVANVTKTIYNIYDASGTLVQVDEMTDGKTTDYIGKIARIAKIGSAETLTYLHHDHLGSISAGSSANGLVSWREQYAPFGFALNQHAVGKNQAGFTGHVHDGATGLIYMQARYYDPYIGRFLSTDPVGFSPAQPFMFGRYTYVNNDPVNAIDPDGLKGSWRMQQAQADRQTRQDRSAAAEAKKESSEGVLTAKPQSTGNSRRGATGPTSPNWNAILAARLRRKIAENDPLNPEGRPRIGTPRTPVNLELLRGEVLNSEYFRAQLTQIENFTTYGSGNFTTNVITTRADIIRMGETFVGSGGRPMSGGKGLHNPATGRGFRYPTLKSSGITQANFLQNFNGLPQANVHVNIMEPSYPLF